MPYQTAKDMIDTTALTALITAFRAEVTQNSISPEKVGSILQQIADLLATAAPDSDMSEFTVLRQRLMGVSTMFTSLAQGTSDRNHIYLTSTTYNVATGTKHTNTDAIRIQQATTERAGAMRAQQVIDLNAAKKNIGELQDDINRIDTLISEIESSIEVLSNDILAIKDSVCLTVEVKGRFLTVQGAEPLLARNMQPYLFRLTKKANRKRYTDSSGQKVKKKNITRKGWHLMGDRDTLKMDRTTGEISINTTVHGNDKREVSYSYHPMDFIKISTDKKGHKQVAYGKRLISLWNGEENCERKVELKYGIAFGFRNRRDGMPTELLYSNIAEFNIIYNPKDKNWSFGK